MGLEDYVYKGNNRIFLPSSNKLKGKLSLEKIEEDGIVIDHIESKKGIHIYILLGLGYRKEYRGVLGTTDSSKMGEKDIVKEITGNLILTDQNINDILGISSNPTISIIRGGQVVEKYKAIRCSNSDCQLYPQHFILDEKGVIRCDNNYNGHGKCNRIYEGDPELIELYKNQLRESTSRQ